MKLKDLFEDARGKKEIVVLLKMMGVKENYTINSDLTVDVDGDVTIRMGFSQTPLQFGRVTGNYLCSHIQTVTSLKGSPHFVGGTFNCLNTKITSLKGGPEHVGATMNCSNTLIGSFEGSPSYIGGHFYSGRGTKIKSLQNIHKQIKHIGGIFQIPDTIKSHVLGLMFIKGLKEVRLLSDLGGKKQVQNIINKHLPGGDVHDVQQELIEAGLSEYAKL